MNIKQPMQLQTKNLQQTKPKKADIPYHILNYTFCRHPPIFVQPIEKTQTKEICKHSTKYKISTHYHISNLSQRSIKAKSKKDPKYLILTNQAA